MINISKEVNKDTIKFSNLFLTQNFMKYNS